jgi:uncharacterized protein
MSQSIKYHGLDVSTDRIAEFCRCWKIAELARFGSVLRDGFRPDSDIDVLVTFAPKTTRRFSDPLCMKEGLEA